MSKDGVQFHMVHLTSESCESRGSVITLHAQTHLRAKVRCHVFERVFSTLYLETATCLMLSLLCLYSSHVCKGETSCDFSVRVFVPWCGLRTRACTSIGGAKKHVRVLIGVSKSPGTAPSRVDVVKTDRIPSPDAPRAVFRTARAFSEESPTAASEIARPTGAGSQERGSFAWCRWKGGGCLRR